MAFSVFVLLAAFLLGSTSADMCSSSPPPAPSSYWRCRLPNTPIPQVLTKLLNPDPEFIPNSSPIVPIHEDGLGYAYVRGTQKNKTSSESLFFLEEDLQPGTRIKLMLSNSTGCHTSFISRAVAETFPFSANEAAKIFRLLSIAPVSEAANLTLETLRDCDTPAITGEVKSCATSLESMVDFVATILPMQTPVQIFSTSVKKAEEAKKLQQFELGTVRLLPDAELAVVCHPKSYAYPVFFCHSIRPTRVYIADAVGLNGMEATVAFVCHPDTSHWNPEHPAFKVLAVKPGTVPICHLMPRGHVVWV